LCGLQVFVHNVAGLRAIAQGKEWVDKMLIPYTNVLKRGKVIQGEVVESKQSTPSNTLRRIPAPLGALDPGHHALGIAPPHR
jgi:hypothetical protein